MWDEKKGGTPPVHAPPPFRNLAERRKKKILSLWKPNSSFKRNHSPTPIRRPAPPCKELWGQMAYRQSHLGGGTHSENICCEFLKSAKQIVLVGYGGIDRLKYTFGQCCCDHSPFTSEGKCTMDGVTMNIYELTLRGNSRQTTNTYQIHILCIQKKNINILVSNILE